MVLRWLTVGYEFTIFQISPNPNSSQWFKECQVHPLEGRSCTPAPAWRCAHGGGSTVGVNLSGALIFDRCVIIFCAIGEFLVILDCGQQKRLDTKRTRPSSTAIMDDDDIPDTRVFVSGLPPNFTSEKLGAHFAVRYQVTDAVALPGRRIGFVGFRNYTLAKNAVKYFDKSYIRMSKISVEIAKPV